jgi:hypothetical protein
MQCDRVPIVLGIKKSLILTNVWMRLELRIRPESGRTVKKQVE